MLFTKAVEIVDAVRKRGLTLRLNGESIVQWAAEQKAAVTFFGRNLILVAVIGYWINRSGTSTKDFTLQSRFTNNGLTLLAAKGEYWRPKS